eukprot:860050-Prorocentrum_minimum.AAC.2
MTKAMLLCTERKAHGESEEDQAGGLGGADAHEEKDFNLPPGGDPSSQRQSTLVASASGEISAGGKHDAWEGFWDCKWPEIIKKIGDGSFAQTWVAKWHMAHVAVKIMEVGSGDHQRWEPSWCGPCGVHNSRGLNGRGSTTVVDSTGGGPQQSWTLDSRHMVAQRPHQRCSHVHNRCSHLRTCCSRVHALTTTVSKFEVRP